VTICKEAVVTNALKTSRQYVEEKAACELCDLESDNFALDCVTEETVRKPRKVLSGATFIFTFPDAMG
jgi:hypothetical protein